MKKLFLLLSAAVCTAPAFAQSQSVVFKNKANNMPFLAAPAARQIVAPIGHNAGNKGTSGAAGEWFEYVNLMFAQGTSANYVAGMAPDSNIKVTYSNGAQNTWLHGFGMSFDPTDSVFRGGDDGHTSAGYISKLTELPSFAVFQSNPYSVDSINFPMWYHRNDHSVVDTLLIVATKSLRTNTSNTQGVVAIHFVSGKASAAPVINPANNQPDSVPTANKIEIRKVMDDAFFADSNANGLSNYALNGIKLGTSGMSLNAGEVLVVYVTMLAGKVYPLNTPSTSANFVMIPTYDLTGTGTSKGEAGQSGNSMNSGLLVNNQTKYNYSLSDTTGFHPYGHNTAIPSVIFYDGAHIDMGVKVTCPTCVPASVPNVNSNVINANAYPNPATSEVSIKFGLKQAANTNVSIMNTVGQIIATQNAGNVNTGSVTFSTANLANGLYFYTIEANGQRTTNRFVVAH
ncbi:MAG: T9SS type A sorting domain-containing protein [Bacteroidetes bacterium]|nr:T9SS type A sorting domain-containing protein [Bacteroidota bacterium]